MQTIKDGNFEKIENVVTPRAFQKCESNSLEMAMKVREVWLLKATKAISGSISINLTIRICVEGNKY